MICNDWPVLLARLRQSIPSLLTRSRILRNVMGSLSGLVLLLLMTTLFKEWDQIADWLYYLTVVLLLKVFAVYTLSLVLAALAWSLITRRLSGTGNVGFHLCIYCTTNLARRLPGVLWHVVGRAVLYGQAGFSKTIIILASAVEQVLIVLSGILVYLLSLAVTSGIMHINTIWLILTLFAGSLIIHPRLIGAVLRRLGRQEIFSIQYCDLVMWLAFYSIIWIVGGYILVTLISPHQPLSFFKQVEIIGAWSLSGAITTLVSFLPAGLGLREVSLVALLGPSIGWSFATFISIMLRLLIMVFEAIWGFIAWQVGGLALIAKKKY